jgi:membrane protease YdiL (CAAX protease family)
LAFLVGVVFVFVSGHASWRPEALLAECGAPFGDSSFSASFGSLFASTPEEIVFRGMLLPEFVERHGTQRGIFLVGIVWAAIHFRSDSYSGMSFAGVLVQMAVHIALCLALNYVLSWMTLRQGSITSAAICHGVWNLLNFLPQRGVDAFPGQLEIKIVLIGVVAIFLFWFWPIKDERPTLASAEGSRPVAAT